MKRPVMGFIVVITFMLIDIYAGIRLFHYINEFNRRDKPVSIEIVEYNQPDMTDRLDVEGDGEDEAVLSHSSGSPHLKPISVFNPLNRDFLREYYGDTRAPRHYEFFDCYYNQTLKTYVFRFLETTPRGFAVMEIDNRGKTLENRLEFDTLERPFKETGKWTPRPQPIDLDADNKKELVVVLNSDDPRNPRGAACFDPDTGRKYWEYYSGTRIENARFFDLDNDGKKEVILTSYAANNEVDFNETNDGFSYVIVLDFRGNLLWKRKVGDWLTHSHAVVSDLEGDGTYEIVASSECTGDRMSEFGTLVIFDAHGTRKLSFPTPIGDNVSFSKPCVRGIPGSGGRIYVGDTGGGLWIFDNRLDTVKKIEKIGPIRVLNTTPPGENLYYLYTRCMNRLLVFDWDLETQIFAGEFDFEGEFEFIPLRPVEAHRALIRADKLYLLTESKVTFEDTVRYWMSSGPLLTVAALLLFNGFFIYSAYRWRHMISRYFRGAYADVIQTSELYDIVRAIVHQAKNPISTVLWTAEKIKRDSAGMDGTENEETLSQLAEVLTENVHLLKRHTREISELVEAYDPSPPP